MDQTIGFYFLVGLLGSLTVGSCIAFLKARRNQEDMSGLPFAVSAITFALFCIFCHASAHEGLQKNLYYKILKHKDGTHEVLELQKAEP